jgi:hypothetical protein
VRRALDHFEPRPGTAITSLELWALAGWILTVDQNYPQHVDYAVRHGFWDTTKQFPIEAGDDISPG